MGKEVVSSNTYVSKLEVKNQEEIKVKLYKAIKDGYPEKSDKEIEEDVQNGLDSRLVDLKDTINFGELKTITIK